jgi:small-conductance mechanosensitive channel
MKKIFFAICLLFSFSFCFAQESPAVQENPAAPEITTNAVSDEEFAAKEKITETDAVTSVTPVLPVIKRFIKDRPFLFRLGLALAIVIGQGLLIWIIWLLFKRLNTKIATTGREKIKPLYINKFRVLSEKHVISVIEVVLKLIKYIVTVIQLFLTIPIIFSLFSATKDIASLLFGYILSPIKHIVIGAIEFIPNLFYIIMIITVTRYVLKALKYFASQIEKGKLQIPGFYTDWARPTLRILQVLLWAFTIAVIYPYLPGSSSKAFQGVSVFIGIVFSVGSTTAIGNLIAGFVITYMRPFKLGDRVQIKDITGFVVEKNLMVVRLKTHKNEYVTFPNLIILGSNIINYNTSSDEDEEGLIIYTEITFGYATPWQTIHDILINAALNTEHIQKKPKPFVLQTKLDDFYATYQINCYTKEVSKLPSIYAELYANIQTGFREAGLDLTTAHYRIITTNKN